LGDKNLDGNIKDNKLGLELNSKDIRLENSAKLLKIEEEYHIDIPLEYKEYLCNYKQDFFQKDVEFKLMDETLQSGEDTLQLDVFLNLESNNNLALANFIERYSHRMPKSLIPIGSCPGGDLICIGVKNENEGKVYFWNHENELEALLLVGENSKKDIDQYWDNLYLVSHSFKEFIEQLQVVDTVESDFDDSIVVDIRISQAFLDRIKNSKVK
jgi:hypothetical protein